MNADELKRLRQFYHSLLGLQVIFNGLSGPNVDQKSLIPLEAEIQNLNNEFPGLFPKFDKHNYFSHSSGGAVYYNLTAIQSLITMIIGRLQISIEESKDTPITEIRQFIFIKDLNLRAIVERDYSEIQKAYISQCWKSVIILSGGAIEAILTDLLISNETSAKSSKSAPKTTDITRWDLSNLIDVSVELKLVSSGVEKLSHSIREYRNLVHPGNEVRNKLKFDAEEAKIALEVLKIVHRDLTV
jgi:hypothetical protein